MQRHADIEQRLLHTGIEAMSQVFFDSPGRTSTWGWAPAPTPSRRRG
ncbi:MAG: hypothetical protein ACPL7G_07940 [Chloroflexia bacterium]